MIQSVKWKCLVLAAALLPAGAVWAAAVNVGERLPAETHMAFWVDDLAKARENAGANPFLQLLFPGESGAESIDNKAVPRLVARLPISPSDPLAPLWQRLLPVAGAQLNGSMESATSVFNLKTKDVLDTFSGSLAVYSTLYDLFVDQGTPIVEWDTIFAASFEAADRPKVDKFLEKALARVPAEAKKKKVSYSGYDVYHIEYFLDEQTSLPGDDPVNLDDALVKQIPAIVEYAYIDNVFLLAEGRGEPLQRAVRALTRSDANFRLANGEGYRAATKALGDGDGDFHFYMNPSHHIREWRDWPDSEAEARLMGTLGVADSGPILARAATTKAGFGIDLVYVRGPEPKGIFALLANAPENKLERLNLVPSDAEALGSVSLDLSQAWTLTKEALGVLTPGQLPMITLGMKNVENLTGIDVERDMLANSRGEMVSYLRPGTAKDDSAAGFVIPMSGTTGAIEAFNKMAKQLSSEETMFLDIEPTPFEGSTLWESTPGALGPQRDGIYAAATAQGVMLGNSGAELRDMVRRAGGKGAGDSVRLKPEMKSFFDALPKDGLRGFAFIPASTLVRDIADAGKVLRTRTGANKVPERAELESGIGNTWWVLQAVEGNIRLRYRIDAPGKE